MLALLLVGCGSVPKQPSASPSASVKPQPAVASTGKEAAPAVPVLPPAGSGRGGYYQDDGPGENPPPGLAQTPDAEPKIEPYSIKGNRPYVVFGKTYTPITDNRTFKQRGVGSWYGKKFHGQKTSSGEPYDMYKMTAAHPTLPIPSYARVTNLGNGAQVIVRVNDRGPFRSDRIIDLSYTAALKLGYLGRGSSELQVERLLPEDIERLATGKQPPPEPQPVSATVPPAAVPQVAELPASAEAAGEQQPLEQVLAAFAAPEASPANAFYLQLGAYTQADNAHAARSRLLEKWASTLPPIEVVEYGVFYRIYSGPFATRDEAAGAVQQVQDAGAAKPMIVQR